MLRSPVTQFLLIGLLSVAAILVGTNMLADRAASDEAIAEARETTVVLARAVVKREVPPGLVNIRYDNLDKYEVRLDQFDREINNRLIKVKTVERVNIWTRDGRLIYSTDLDILLGGLKNSHLDLDPDQRRILQEGGVQSELSDPDGNTNPADVGTEGMVRIYTPMRSPEHRKLLFEAYYSLDDIGQRRTEIYDAFRWITLGALVIVIVAATFILLGLSRKLAGAGRERERLLRSAIDASDAERRRIARDLHDSVVQDLAGTAFSVSAVARDPLTPPESRRSLAAAGSSLRTSLKSLRSLLAEIHPPELHAEGLAAALADLTAPAAAAGIQASATVEGAETLSDARAALLWRVAQEAVRNALRHSRASTLAVTVRGDGECVTLEVVDDGVGFDPAVVADPHSYGLRGLRSLVADNGGTLEVRSSPGEGTTVHMEVEAR